MPKEGLSLCTGVLDAATRAGEAQSCGWLSSSDVNQGWLQESR